MHTVPERHIRDIRFVGLYELRWWYSLSACVRKLHLSDRHARRGRRLRHLRRWLCRRRRQRNDALRRVPSWEAP